MQRSLIQRGKPAQPRTQTISTVVTTLLVRVVHHKTNSHFRMMPQSSQLVITANSDSLHQLAACLLAGR